MSAIAAGPRDASVDWLRGVVMALMALDHARDFVSGFGRDPTDLATTTPLLFATRWVTHFCAPVFVCLAGTAAYLYGSQRPASAATRFLLTRGAWLVLLELTVVRFAWIPDPLYRYSLLQVIWAIGWSMIALAGLARLPWAWVLAVGAVIVGGHDSLDGIHADQLGAWRTAWLIVHERGRFDLSPDHHVMLAYPLLPWIGTMALGWCFGRAFTLPERDRRRLTLRLGLAFTAGFVLLRAVNVYGDPEPWSAQASWPFDVMAFLNCEKYPPSLAYLLMTLGPALVALSLAPASDASRLARPFVVLGRVPLLFYVAHLYLLRFAALPFAYLRFGAGAFAPPPHGAAGSPRLGLEWVYPAWLLALLVLYPLCAWYARLKARKRSWWMSYL